MSIRIEPIGTYTSVPIIRRISPTSRISKIRRQENEKNESREKLYRAIDSQVTNAHLRKYLDKAGRKYNYYPQYGECWLKERRSRLFNTVVSHIFTKYSLRISIQALLIKRFSPEEQEILKSFLPSIPQEGKGAFTMGYQGLPDDMIAVINEYPIKLSILSSLNDYLDNPMDTYFKEEQGIFDYLYGKK